MKTEMLSTEVDRGWADAIGPLEDYIAIPALSPDFDTDWERNGHIEQAVELVVSWCEQNAPGDATVTVHRLEAKTPAITIEIPAFGAAVGDDRTVLLYGHLDKQPEMVGWDDGLGPWTPVWRGDRLYGRGGADDGYAAFAAVIALNALRACGGSHARCVILIEASEESGSIDLPAHIETLIDVLGAVDLVVCLDSGAADYSSLWLTTSLRGLLSARIRVEVLTQGQHSGMVGGFVPDSTRVMRQLLARIEDATTGEILLDGFSAEVPEHRIAEAARSVDLGVDPRASLPLPADATPIEMSALDALIASSWSPSLAVIGADGFPATDDAGNVLRPFTTMALSFRLPPTVDPHRAHDALAAALSDETVPGAAVHVEVDGAAAGWHAPATAPWLHDVLAAASTRHFGRTYGSMGIGGSIPFMAMLGERFVDAQYVITGVLGPESNAHGPNEFLHLPTARKVSACVAEIVDAHSRVGGHS